MKRLLLWTAALAIATILTVTGYKQTDNTAGISGATNGAFRDGAYLGKLAADRGEQPHIAFGRWRDILDRKAFVEGYESGYKHNVAGRQGQPEANPNTDAAFRDGLFVAKLDLENGRSARETRGRWVKAEDKASFVAGYRQAFDENAAELQGTKGTSEAVLIH
jgi:hypothetical protein